LTLASVKDFSEFFFDPCPRKWKKRSGDSTERKKLVDILEWDHNSEQDSANIDLANVNASLMHKPLFLVTLELTPTSGTTSGSVSSVTPAKGSTINFDVSLEGLKAKLSQFYEMILNSFQSFPRIETKIYPYLGERAANRTLAVSVSSPEGRTGYRHADTLVWDIHAEMMNRFDRSCDQMVSILELYDEYKFLVDEESFLVQRLATEPSLEECEKFILKYRRVCRELEEEALGSITCGMIRLECRNVNRQLGDLARALSNLVMEQIAKRARQAHVAICDSAKAWTQRLMKPLRPTDPNREKTLVDQYAALTDFETDEYKKMKARYQTAIEQLSFLLTHSYSGRGARPDRKEYHKHCDQGSGIVRIEGLAGGPLEAIPVKMPKRSDRRLRDFMVNDDTGFSDARKGFWEIEQMKKVIDKSRAMLSEERCVLETAIEARSDVVRARMEELAKSVLDVKDYSEYQISAKYVKNIEQFKLDLDTMEAEISDLNERESLLGLQQSEFEQLQESRDVLAPFNELWTMVKQFQSNIRHWMLDPVFFLDADEVNEQVDSSYQKSNRLVQEFADDSKAASMVAAEVKRKLSDFRVHTPLITVLCNKGMRERHWEKVSSIVKGEVRPDNFTPLKRMIDRGFGDFISQLSEVSEAALQEYAIENQLNLMREQWKTKSFKVRSQKELEAEAQAPPIAATNGPSLSGTIGGPASDISFANSTVLGLRSNNKANEKVVITDYDDGAYILDSEPVEEVQTLIDDQIVKVQTMKSSPFVVPFEDDINKLQKWLIEAQETVEAWMRVQTGWLYLGPVFGAGDILKQMPKEGKIFGLVDTAWRALMTNVKEDPLVTETMKMSHLKKNLLEALERIETIKKSLTGYLNAKRLFFPRFFLLSDSELLEILSQAKDPKRIQGFLPKIFEGISRLEFSENMDISHVVSKEGETIPMARAVNPNDCKSAVEQWMKQLEFATSESVKEQLWLSLRDRRRSQGREHWIPRWPGQVVCVVGQILWAQAIETSMSEETPNALALVRAKCQAQLLETVKLLKGKCSPSIRKTLGTLIVQGLHRSGVTDKMITEGTDSWKFNWQCQMRYYWENGKVIVRVLSNVTEYQFEYLGPPDRLVVTPLTERCYHTLMAALNLGLGGAPVGPAGSGKTETVKDLAKAVGVRCVVFNCSDGLNHKAMGRLFKGLSAGGLWACLDDINRITLPVLSVVAQQVQTVLAAKRQRSSAFAFDDVPKLPLRQSCAFFITMNPESDRYGGRNPLPYNLLAQFRTVAMMKPDKQLIAEVMLHSYGFQQASLLAKKVVTSFRLFSELLSDQVHYNQGMRSVISVLRVAGHLKKKREDAKEGDLVLRALREMNIPKLLPKDIEIFYGIMRDVFPHLAAAPAPERHKWLKHALLSVCNKKALNPEPLFLTKVIQLYETLAHRKGAIVLGKSMTGKTTMIHTLRDALTALVKKHKGTPIHINRVNPKAMTSSRLFGNYVNHTREWRDGVLPSIFRSSKFKAAEDKNWLVLDGPVDTGWAEGLNTALDDNRQLCLASGEVIQLQNHICIIFESQSIYHASPATISRCGVVHIPDGGLIPLKSQFIAWTKTLPSMFERQHIARLLLLYDRFFLTCVEGSEKLPRYTQTSAIILLKAFIRFYRALTGQMRKEKNVVQGPGKVMSITDGFFIFSLVWAVGGTLTKESRVLFDHFLRKKVFEAKQSQLHSGSGKRTTGSRILRVRLPKKGSLFDYSYNFRSQSWMSWKERVPVGNEVKIPRKSRVSSVIIPTPTLTCAVYLLDMYRKANISSLVVGPSGCGKSTALRKSFQEIPFLRHTINLSSRTSSDNLKRQISSQLERRRRGIYGPPGGRDMCVILEDLNHPKQDKYGTRGALQAVRQLMSAGGWYDPNDDNSKMREILNVHLHAEMQASEITGVQISERVLSLFLPVGLSPLEGASLTSIFTQILGWHLRKGFVPEIRSLARPIVEATNFVYEKAKKSLLPTPQRSHYQFSPRDVVKVVEGLAESSSVGFQSAQGFARLWIHEIHRVFSDRLVPTENKNEKGDREEFLEWVRLGTREKLCMKFDIVCSRLASRQNGRVDRPEQLDDLLFGDYYSYLPESSRHSEGESPAEEKRKRKVYTEMPSGKTLRQAWEDMLSDYNSFSTSPLDIILFDFAIHHASKLARILRQPQGHALLLGITGNGKRSITKLTSFVAGHRLVEVTRNSTLSYDGWKKQLRETLTICGAEGETAVLFVPDADIRSTEYIEDVHSLIVSDQVPFLFDTEARAAAIETLRKGVKLEGRTLRTTSPAELFDLFISRCKERLHLVVSMNSAHTKFRQILREYPSLVKHCGIDWFGRWPTEALVEVANRFLGPEIVDGDGSTVEFCTKVHTGMTEMASEFTAKLGRTIHITPVSYMFLMESFQRLLSKRQKENLDAQRRYSKGLAKLAEAEQEVQHMKELLQAQKPKLEEASIKVTDMIAVVEKETEEAEKVRIRVNKETKEANEAASKAENIAQECKEDLDRAMPPLQAAINSLNSLTQKEIAEVKSMTNPPSGVKLVMSGLCIMLDVKPEKKRDESGRQIILDYWGPAKSNKVLGDPRLLKRLLEFDRDNFPPRAIRRVRELLAQDDMNLERIEKLNKATFAIASWITALEGYERVVKVVEPKKKKHKEATEKYKSVRTKLESAQAELRTVMSLIDGLKRQEQAADAKRSRLEREIQNTMVKKRRAEELLSGLAGEKIRWRKIREDLAEKADNMFGDVLLASCIISYMAPFTPKYRKRALSSWKRLCSDANISFSPNITLEGVLGDPVEIERWIEFGLPRDSVSIENAIIIKHSAQWPLLIDPQLQATMWIKTMERDRKLRTAKLGDSKTLIRVVELSIKMGHPCFIEGLGECTSITKSLDHVLRKQTVLKGGETVILLGNKEVPYSQDFRLYLATSNPNPPIPPHLASKVCVMDFTATNEGIVEQLLGIMVARERAQLEERRVALIRSSAGNVRRLKNIEDKILNVLSDSQGSVLEDERAIEVLQSSKALSSEIEAKQKILLSNQWEIYKMRLRYKPAARHAAALYSCISKLSSVSIAYAFSLKWFKELFEQAIERSEYTEEVPKRVEILNSFLTGVVFDKVSRSVFSRHRLLFSLLLTTSILEQTQEIHPTEIQFIISGELDYEDLSNDEAQKEDPTNYLPKESWEKILRLSNLPSFQEGFLELKAKRDSERKLDKIYSLEDKSDDASPTPLCSSHSFSNSSEVDEGFLGVKVPLKGNDEESLAESFKIFASDWKRVIDSSNPFLCPFPGRFADLTPFRRLMIIRILRPDALVPSTRCLVSNILGPRFIDSPLISLPAIFRESSPSVPLLFILSPEADPWSIIVQFAQSTGFEERMDSISLGEGQEQRSEALIEKATKAGTWVVLQNCHLLPEWLPRLEQIFQKTADDHAHPHFRLWLTTKPSKEFPLNLMQRCLKLAPEPPVSFRDTLKRAYHMDPISDAGFFHTVKARILKQLTYGLCFFHAVVRERAKMGSVGWNQTYTFHDSDLSISATQLRQQFEKLDRGGVINLKLLRYIIGECNYGGKITDPIDQRCLRNILSTYICKDISSPGYSLAGGMTEDSTFKVPPEMEEGEGYQEYIQNLPIDLSPEVLGMHPNTEISRGVSEKNQLLEGLHRAINGHSGDNIQRLGSNDTKKLETFIENTLEEIRSPDAWFDMQNVRELFPVAGGHMYNAALHQECERYTTLLTTLISTLTELRHAIRGEILMTDNLEKMAEEIKADKVPEVWKTVSYLTERTLTSYVKDLLNRLDFIRDWATYGPPRIWWLPGVFSPSSLITAALLSYARQQEVSVDDVSFEFDFESQPAEHFSRPQTASSASAPPTAREDMEIKIRSARSPRRPAEGLCIKGVHIEGARWDSKAKLLLECEGQQLCSEGPIVWLKPKLRKDQAASVRNAVGQYQYECPLYQTQSRRTTPGHTSNFVTYIQIPTTMKPTHWVIRGVGMILQLTE